MEAEGSTDKAILFAILGNGEAIPWITQQYRPVDRLYRSRPIFSYPQKMTYLNALYHLPSLKALPFVNEVIENPQPARIRPRAEKVRARILELPPELCRLKSQRMKVTTSFIF